MRDPWRSYLHFLVGRRAADFATISVAMWLAISTAVAAGPDLIVGELGAIPSDGSLALGPVDDVMAYAFSTEACNVGDDPVSWVIFGLPEQRNQHPVIAQNMFRLKDGRFEQIGQSWLKHAFCGVNDSLCGTCPVENQTGCESLAAGCSDPYGASLNAEYPFFHLRLGPKSDVNAATGYFPFDSSDNPCGEWCPLPTFSEVDRRLQVGVGDVDPAQNLGAHYFIEGQYISPDESAAGNGGDNMSWREVAITPVTLEASVALGSVTHRRQPAIFAWQSVDPEVVITELVIPDDGGPGFDGRMWIAANATDLGDGWWHYEYAVQNVTSDRSARALIVTLPSAAQLQNVGFHDVNYHSGERIDSADWSFSRDGELLEWSTASYAEDEYANALRWGTLYNFRFDTDVAPHATGSVELAMFKPGTAASVTAQTVAPISSLPCNCPGDVNGDGQPDGHDVEQFVAMYLGSDAPNACADIAAPMAGTLDADDVTAFVVALLAQDGCL